MADVFSKRKRSEVMSRIRGRGNEDTELALVRLLRANGISGWRRHSLVRATVQDRWLRVEGRIEGRKTRRQDSQHSTFNTQLTVRPDFVFRKQRAVIFVDGCFWHGCPRHATKPKNNRELWRRKLSANKTRNALVTRTLRRSGWRVLRVWGHTLRWATKDPKNEARLIRRLSAFIGVYAALGISVYQLQLAVH